MSEGFGYWDEDAELSKHAKTKGGLTFGAPETLNLGFRVR